MAISLTEFLSQVEILLGPDDANLELSVINIRDIIKSAVARYSRDAPDDVFEDETGADGKYYDIDALLGSWVEGFSRIEQIEYPADDVGDNQQPVYLSDEDWNDDYWSGSTRYLFFPNHAPAATETIRIKYTAPYTFDGSDETLVPAQDFYAICNLAAGLCCRAIATKYSRTTDSTITADSARHTSRAGEFARRAKDYIDYYNEHMGLTGAGNMPAYQPPVGVFMDLDTRPSQTRSWLHHRDR